MPERIRAYWAQYLAAVGTDDSARFYEAFHFDDNEATANELAALVLNGTKCATASLLWSYETSGKPLPVPGSLSVVTDWHGHPLCVIESTAVDTVAYEDVTEAFAAAEGEGDGSLTYWRRVHWAYFQRECARIGRLADVRMPVVCETFSVVYGETPGLT